MIIKKNFCILLLTGVILAGGRAAEPPAPLISTCGNEDPKEITSNFPVPVLYTDRDIYIAGEYLYFSAKLPGPVIPGETGRLAFIALRGSGGNTVKKGIAAVDRGYAWGGIYLDDTLSTGIYQIICFEGTATAGVSPIPSGREVMIANRFDSDMDEFIKSSGYLKGNERRSHDPKYTPEEPNIRISSNRKRYGTREPVIISLETEPHNEYPVWASLSAAREETLLWCPDGISAGEHGSPDPKGNSSERHQHTAIRGGLQIRGMARSNETGAPMPGLGLFLTMAGEMVNLYHTVTCSNGTFSFVLNDYHETSQVYISPQTPEMSGICSITLNDEFDTAPPYIPGRGIRALPSTETIKKSQDITTINKLFGISLHHEKPGPDPWQFRRPLLYSRPANRVFPENFIPLDNLMEIARELVPQWQMRYRGDRLVSRLVNSRTGTYFDDAPALFLDGVHIMRPEDIIHLGSQDIGVIEVHNYPWRYGDAEFSGIISIKSTNEAYLDVTSSGPYIVADIPEVIPRSTIMPPAYEEDPERNDPDFRQTLYWEPEIIFSYGEEKKELRFYSGDLAGTYIVKVEGLSSFGNPFSEYLKIVVE
ncbi:MAG: hypothetical protein EA408_02545 [Marinilabiliales bacterium]|nr:MAG: hypothetical protein EA408_02545 [Marinilabiliales bacterium]